MTIIPELENLNDYLYYSIIIREFDEDIDHVNDFSHLMFVASFDLTIPYDFEIIRKYINTSYDIFDYRFIYSKDGKVQLNVVVYA